MRITKISVKKLFGVYDHEIELKQDFRITIIHGANGVGKTTLLRMVDGLFKLRYSLFTQIPFRLFCMAFSSGEALVVEQQLSQPRLRLPELMPDVDVRTIDESQPHVTITHRNSDGSLSSPYIVPHFDERQHDLYEFVDSIPDLRRVEYDSWYDISTGRRMSAWDILETYGLEEEFYGSDQPDWLHRIRDRTRTGFIPAQRLQRHVSPSSRKLRLPSRIPSLATTVAVDTHSKDLARSIGATLTRYGERSQQIDRSFPTRLMETNGSQQLDQELLESKLQALVQKTTQLMELGLFERKDAPDIPRLDPSEGSLTRVLSVYAQDIEDKLSVFDDLSTQLRLLSNIINERFDRKELRINKDQGFVVVARDDQQIPLSSLSSGEQHQLVLFYRLLFDVEPNSLIMIDEPELSLHVAWQRHFLGDIERIAKLRDFDIILATHSPQIVDNRYDLMVGLGDPDEEY